MEKIIIEIVTVAIGFALIIFRRPFVSLILSFQKNVLNLQRDTVKKEKAGLRTIPIFGLIIVIIGFTNLIAVLVN